jgi:amidase
MISRRQLLLLLGSASCASWQAHGDVVASPHPPSASREALHFLPLLEAAGLLRAGEITSVELTRHVLSRIATLDGRLNSFFAVTPERALAQARDADREIGAGRHRGPLHGVPIAVKDLFDTEGVVTTGGLHFLRENVPDEDATVVARLRAAGAVLLGKLAMTEGAMAGYHRDFRIPVNPWAPDRWTGGSSSGSGVATAAGLCFASLGSDTGGSIRFPAAANALVGLKPTYGRVSRHGVMPLAPSLDHVGPMARTVADAAALFEVIAGHDPRDPSSLDAPVADLLAGLAGGLRDTRIGFDRDAIESSGDAGLTAAVKEAMEHLGSLGAEVVELSSVPVPGATGEVWFTLAAYEAYLAHRPYMERYSPEAYGDYFREFLEQGASVAPEAVERARQAMAEFAGAYGRQLATVDVLAGPAAGVAPPVAPEMLYGGGKGFEAIIPRLGLQFTLPANLAGAPALCLPCGFSEDGVPYSLQLTARPLGEARLFRIAQAYEQTTPWHLRHPDV